MQAQPQVVTPEVGAQMAQQAVEQQMMQQQSQDPMNGGQPPMM